MASEWYGKVLGQEVGPIGFPDMAEMVRSGTLKEDDQVRRKGTTEWISARDVIGLFRAAKKQPAQATPPAAKPEPAQAPLQPPAPQPPPAPTRRTRKRQVLLGVGLVFGLLLLVVSVSALRSRQSERFPEPQAGKPRSVDNMENAPVTTPGRLDWDFRQGLDEKNMKLLTGGGAPAVCTATSEGIRCTIPPGYARVQPCGVELGLGLRGDFEITARYQIFSLPPGEPGGFPGLKLSIWDVNGEWAQMGRQNRFAPGNLFTAHHREAGGKVGSGSERTMPTSVTVGRLSLRRTGTTLHYLVTTDQSEELVELRTVDFSPDDVTKIHLAAQTRGSVGGIDMVWQDLHIESDAVLGLADKGAAP
jgi:hypothetical protein